MVEKVERSLVPQKLEVNIQKNQQNGSMGNGKYQELSRQPADGGSRAWVIMLASFFCNGILFGVINSYGVLYKELYDNLQKRNVTNASGQAALVGSFSMGTVFLVSPVSGVLTDLIGIRKTTFLGGAIASSGMFLSSFFTGNIVILCITYGVMYGLGGALAYTPSLAILGHYFKKYLGKVNGFVTAGSSVFTIVMPYFMDAIIHKFGIEWTLRTLALMSSMIMIIAFLFKPIKKGDNQIKKQISCGDVFNISLVKNFKYLVWVSVIAFSLFGYFVPYVLMLKFVETNFDEGSDTRLPIMCIGLASGIGRLIFGTIADLPKINIIYVQQISFFSIGVMTMLLPFTAGHYAWLVAITLAMGVFDGCFISLLGPIAFDLCGREGATQAIGFLLGVCAIPLTIGPYVAGVILDATKSYTIPFILAGIPPVIGSFGLFIMKCARNKSTNNNVNGTLDGIKESLTSANNKKESLARQEEDIS
ncbi:unnamed protein product [Psylliodes chrysocephalus]|uniref:Major facilitator superfamily (MFS) profile domain-containing protein n=1 Tax=Psylliodes chrysocephalus TaxID=3402493 RepID=A0A9P0D505_9CUCU|nr:unnamed protein product [Psylliodes chrysocephala]